MSAPVRKTRSTYRGLNSQLVSKNSKEPLTSVLLVIRHHFATRQRARSVGVASSLSVESDDDSFNSFDSFDRNVALRSLNIHLNFEPNIAAHLGHNRCHADVEVSKRRTNDAENLHPR